MKSIFSFAIVFFFSTQAFSFYYGPNTSLFDQAVIDTVSRSPMTVHQKNLEHLQEFIAMDVDQHTQDDAYGFADFIDFNVASQVVTAISRNPVVSSSVYYKYDPDNKGIGFCFGRAMFANVELNYRKLDSDSMKKAFIVGPMDTGSGSWGWHVATIAQGKDAAGNEVWYALDPITGAMPVQQWYEHFRNDYSTDKLLKLYITDVSKFGPSPGQYHQQALANPFYNQYFNDMMSWFERQASKDVYDSITLPNQFD